MCEEFLFCKKLLELPEVTADFLRYVLVVLVLCLVRKVDL